MNAIIEALGIEVAPAQEPEILSKIISDNLVTLRAQELMVASFAATAIRQMNPLERAALIKKLLPPKPQPTRVVWAIDKTPVTQEWFIFASISNQAVHFTGTPEQARTWKFAGESVPTEILNEYAKAYKPHALIGSEEYARLAKQEPQDKSHVPGDSYMPRERYGA